MTLLFKIVLFPFVTLGKLFSVLFGQVNWTMPAWLTYLFILGKRSPAKLGVLTVALVGVGFFSYKAYEYIKQLPKPVLVEAIITLPNITDAMATNTDGSTPRLPVLTIEFVYALSEAPYLPVPEARANNANANMQRTMLVDYPSVAPIALIGEEITSGISMHPNKAGVWRWTNDRTLEFLPDTPWPAGQLYEVSFSTNLFDTQDTFTNDEFSFVTHPLEATVGTSEFELNIENKLKQVFVEILFNYPVDVKSVEQALTMRYQVADNKLESIQQPYTLSISDNLRKLSAILPVANLPDQARILDITLNEGVKSIYGGEATSTAIESKVIVPDLYSYLQVEQANIEIVRNPDNEPEQFILLSFTDPISRSELLNKLSLHLLPNETEDNAQTNQRKSRNNYWQSPREVTADVLNRSTLLDYALMPNASDDSKNYQIKIDVVPRRQLYLKIAPGLTSANGFVQRAFFDNIYVAPQYPQEVIIAGEGSILTHSANQRLAFSTRGLQDVKITIGKVKDSELYHLVSQTQGDINNPRFYSWQFTENNLAEFTTQFLRMNGASANQKAASYASVDLNGLLGPNKTGLGLFFVEIKGWDVTREREIYNVADKLLVLVTDLGVIVKTSQNGAQDIFVQSIKTGKPETNASVELIAKNGTPIFTKTTGPMGHVSLPSAAEFTQEKEPVVYVVKQNGDVSFIPYNRYTRQINYSRFDVGGEYSYGGEDGNENDRVNAYMFTDRGIYRPGESVNIGMIVKGKNMQTLTNIPLELVVRDTQYDEVFVEKISLPKFGFTESSFLTQKHFKTGNYTASLYLTRERTNNRRENTRDRQVGSLNFDVEEFQPDTLSITSEIQNLPAKGWATAPLLSSEVTLTNLFGVPAQNRRVTSRLNVIPTPFRFDEFADVDFYSAKTTDNSSDGIKSIEENLKEQLTNADGQAIIEADLSRFTKGTYTLSMQINGFEASGGRSVSTTSNWLYSPSPYLVGFKAGGKLNFINVNSERELALIAINNSLAPIAVNDLSLRLSKIQNVSTLVKQYNGRYQYESIESRDIISATEYALPANFHTLNLDTSAPGNYVLELLNANNDIVLSVPYTIVGASNDSAQLDKNAELTLVLNKSDFQAGETIELSIQAPYAGSGLISIESDKLHSFKWFTSKTKSSVQSITLPKNIEGNAYINVAFVRDPSSTEIFTSPLSYAVAPFSIDRSMRTLNVALEVDDIVEPGKPMSISLNVSEDASVAVFAVDIGILQVASYRTPNPLNHFLKKRALDVRTMQIMDLILPDFALTQMLSAAGGDTEAIMLSAQRLMGDSARMKSSNPFERKVQDPAVFWSGVVNASKGNNNYTFTVPNDFAGALRVMAIAVGENTMGSTQETTLVRGPFVLSPSVLAQAAPFDEFDVSLNVANVIKNSPNNAPVAISVSTSEHLDLVGSNTAQLYLSENQEEAARFRVKANSTLGGAAINFTVNMTDPSGKTWQSTTTATLSVRPAMPFEVNIYTGVANNGEVSLSTPLALFEAQSQQLIRASTSPLVITEGLSAYLNNYPHGCTEQIVSQVFPLVGLSNLKDYAPSNEKVSAHFASLISTLRQRQSYAGGFSYWPGAQQDDIDISVYVMHFLIEAQDLGYAAPQDMLESGLGFLSQQANAFVVANQQASKSSNKAPKQTLRSLRQRAHIIYLLTRSSVVTSNLLIDLVTTLNQQHGATWHKDLLSAYIASSYSLMQQTQEATKLIGAYDLSDKALVVDQAFAGLAPRITLDSQYLYLLAKHFPEQLNSISGQAVVNITQAIYKGQYNTISAAYSVLALGAYHGALNSAGNTSLYDTDQQIVFTANIANSGNSRQTQKQLTPSYTPFASAYYNIGTTSVTASLPNTGNPVGTALYYVNMQAGYQSELPKTAVDNGIEIQRAFVDSKGNSPTNIRQGDELTVRLRVRASALKSVDNVAIVDLLPGGFEVIRESVERSANPWQSDYIDIREDRIVFYGNLSNRVSEISYKVKVTAAGNFTVPSSFAESMYDRSLNGYSAASSLVVNEAR